MSDRNIEAIYRLSSVQEGLLFHTIAKSRPGAYFEQYTCQFEGALDPQRLARAWTYVIERHTALRTLFTWERREKPLQIVREHVALPWQYYDWREYPAHEQESMWRTQIRQDRDHGFELSVAPLIRLALIRLSDHHYSFLWSFHHMLLDGWSMRIVLDDVAHAYRSLGKGENLVFEPVRPYADFIAWLETLDPVQAQAYWQDYLAGFHGPTCPDPGSATTGRQPLLDASAVQRTTLSPAHMQQLESFARDERLTLNSLIVGAWALVLSRYTQSDDIVFGVTVSGRPPNLEGAEHCVGLFINTLPLRIRVQDDAELSSWLREIQTQLVQMREFEHTPLVDINRWSDVTPGVPLFETIVVFENFPARGDRFKTDGELEYIAEDYIEYSHYPLALLAVPGDGMELIAVYDPSRFAEAAVGRILQHVTTALTAMAVDPVRKIGQISVLPPAEREQILVKWNETAVPLDTAESIHELLELQFKRAPDAIALISDDEELTYAEMDDHTTSLASYLIKRGVGPGTIVPIFAERSIEAVVAIFATLKTGAAYVILDGHFPVERVHAIIDDLADGTALRVHTLAPMVLVQNQLDGKLGNGALESVSITREWKHNRSSNFPDASINRDSDDLAYIVYTSGSTGRPKGVMVSHRNRQRCRWNFLAAMFGGNTRYRSPTPRTEHG